MATVTTLFSIVAAFAAFILLIDVLGTTFAKGDTARRKLIAAIVFPIMMLYCLTNAVTIDGVIVDPRNVPLTMAVFAGGWRTLLTTALTGIAVRIGMGGPDTALAVIGFIVMGGLSGVIYIFFQGAIRPMPVKLILSLAVMVNIATMPLFMLTTSGASAMMSFFPQLLLVNTIGIVFMGLHIRYIQQRNVLLEALEAESAQKSRFLAVMGHEMRSPLNAIMGYTYAVNDASGAQETREAMEKIRASSRHAIGMFENLLDSTRIEAGEINLSQNTFSLRQFLDLIADQARPTLERKQLDFHIRLAETLPDYVRTDEFRLRQIIVNLIDNATKYTTKGSVCVTVSMTGAHKNQLTVLVEDTGIGIAEDDFATIFKPYQQTARAEDMRRAGVSGAGLGLSIVEGLVRALKGKISVVSVPNKGTAFSLTIPTETLAADELAEATSRSKDAEPARQADAPKRLGRPRILVIDDDEANRKIMGIHLELGGYDYSIAGNGVEALDHLEKERFDLVLVDRHMPVMNGLAFAKAVRSDVRPSIQALKLVLVTGASPQDKGMAEVLDLVDGRLQKPVNFPALGSIIDGYITMDQALRTDTNVIELSSNGRSAAAC